MEILIRKTIRVNAENYYINHFNIINLVLDKKLTDTEIKIITNFMLINESMKLNNEDIFNSYARKQVREKMNNMSPGGLGNHLKSMINKKFLQKDNITKRITINNNYIPGTNRQGYQFKLFKQES